MGEAVKKWGVEGDCRGRRVGCGSAGTRRRINTRRCAQDIWHLSYPSGEETLPPLYFSPHPLSTPHPPTPLPSLTTATTAAAVRI